MRLNHSTNCLKVQSRKSLTVDDHQDEPDCPLCELGVTKDIDRGAPTAIEIATLIYKDNKWSKRHLHSSLRTLISECETRLQNLNCLAERVGVSVKSVTHWQSERPSNSAKEFDTALADALTVNLVFDLVYTHNKGYEDIADYFSNCDGTKTDTNVIKTIQWLQSHHVFENLGAINDLISLQNQAQKEAEAQQDDSEKSEAEETESTDRNQPQSESNSQSNIAAF